MNTPNRRYCAFISYRHADNVQEGRRWAEWVHRALERYVVPPDLVGQPNLRGEPIPRSLYPIFRDEDELPANADLASGIRAALEASHCMIVLCSPRSAVSPWVRKEVREFKDLGRGDRILAVIVAGEPNADDPVKARDGVMRDEECFCEELRFGASGANGKFDWSLRTEPTAADLRPIGTRAEGFVTAEAYREYLTLNSSHPAERIAALTETYRQRLEQGLLKAIAGLLGVALGTLIDRDAAHRADLAKKELARAQAESARLRSSNRRLTAVVIAALVLASLAGFFWWKSGRDARAASLATAAEYAAETQAVAEKQSAVAAEHQAESERDNATRSDYRNRIFLAQSAYDRLDIGHAEELLRGCDPSLREFEWGRLAAVVDVSKTALLGHSEGVDSVAFSPDGRRIVSGSGDGTVKIWQTADHLPGEDPHGSPQR